MKDSEISNLISREEERQKNGIELIASENFVSPDVLKACGSVLTNKYAEGYPGKRYYGGCEVVDEVENLAKNRLKKLFGATYVNVQPHSGSQANTAVYLSILKPGDKIMGFDLSHGGHLTHGSPVNFSGKLFQTCFYGVERSSGLLNYEKIYQAAQKEKPQLIICGASAYSRDIDFKKFREIANSIGAILVADIAHPAGLIAKKILSDPLPYCHIITSTTHKTLRGPRGGIIMMGKDFENPLGKKNKKGDILSMSSLLDSSVFPGIQGGPLMHTIAAKAVCFEEALSPEFAIYAQTVKANAQKLCVHLNDLGYAIVSQGTDNHCFLIDLRNKGVSGKEAENALSKANITVNKNMVPFDDKTPFVTSGIRIGTAAITTRGLQPADMKQIAAFIDNAIQKRDSDSDLEKIKSSVKGLMQFTPLFHK